MTTSYLVDHGISTEWKEGGPLLKEWFQVIIDQVDKLFPDPQVNLVLNTTWLSFHQDILEKEYARLGTITNLFLVAPIDDMDLNFPFPKGNFNMFQIGHISNSEYEKYHVSFLPMFIKRLFPKHTEEDLAFVTPTYKFLCYQNKTHEHRQRLTKQLMDIDLLKYGLLTLGEPRDPSGEYMFPELKRRFLEEEENMQFNGIQRRPGKEREDPFSFGNMSIWRHSFLNVVSESSLGNQYFITEKTYKPILGMRPFVLLTHLGTSRYLKDMGFYTFEEYWGVKENWERVDYAVDVIKVVCSMPEDEIQGMYKDMLPKLQHNRTRFFQHEIEQMYKLHNLFHE